MILNHVRCPLPLPLTLTLTHTHKHIRTHTHVNTHTLVRALLPSCRSPLPFAHSCFTLPSPFS